MFARVLACLCVAIRLAFVLSALCIFLSYVRAREEKIFRSIAAVCSGLGVVTRWKWVNCVGEKSPFAFSENSIFNFLSSPRRHCSRPHTADPCGFRSAENPATKWKHFQDQNTTTKPPFARWRPGSKLFSALFTLAQATGLGRRLPGTIIKALYSPNLQHSLHSISQINTCFPFQRIFISRWRSYFHGAIYLCSDSLEIHFANGTRERRGREYSGLAEKRWLIRDQWCFSRGANNSKFKRPLNLFQGAVTPRKLLFSRFN